MLFYIVSRFPGDQNGLFCSSFSRPADENGSFSNTPLASHLKLVLRSYFQLHWLRDAFSLRDLMVYSVSEIQNRLFRSIAGHENTSFRSTPRMTTIQYVKI